MSSCVAPFAVTVQFSAGRGLDGRVGAARGGTLSQPMGTTVILFDKSHTLIQRHRFSPLSLQYTLWQKTAPEGHSLFLQVVRLAYLYNTNTNRKKSNVLGADRPFKSAPTSTWFHNICICLLLHLMYTVIIRLFVHCFFFFCIHISHKCNHELCKELYANELFTVSGGAWKHLGGFPCV